jgi:uncharacterized protein
LILKGIVLVTEISIIIGDITVTAELNDSATSKLLADKLPIEADYNTWGDEIYFTIPVKTGSENPKSVVKAGEIGYWPPGNAFCIFYGATPGSTVDEIRPASPVNPLGHIKGNPDIFKKIAGKYRKIRLELKK